LLVLQGYIRHFTFLLFDFNSNPKSIADDITNF